MAHYMTEGTGFTNAGLVLAALADVRTICGSMEAKIVASSKLCWPPLLEVQLWEAFNDLAA